jgi:hypothetical protein
MRTKWMTKINMNCGQRCNDRAGESGEIGREKLREGDGLV